MYCCQFKFRSFPTIQCQIGSRKGATIAMKITLVITFLVGLIVTVLSLAIMAEDAFDAMMWSPQCGRRSHCKYSNISPHMLIVGVVLLLVVCLASQFFVKS